MIFLYINHDGILMKIVYVTVEIILKVYYLSLLNMHLEINLYNLQLDHYIILIEGNVFILVVLMLNLFLDFFYTHYFHYHYLYEIFLFQIIYHVFLFLFLILLKIIVF